jgi:2-polyprenyl-3-methyl-5-hydroxy-6-metoxy-1,4-benzoquinol methylase
MKIRKILNNICPLCKKVTKSELAGLSDYWMCKSCSLGWIKSAPKATYEANYYNSGSTLLSTLFIPVEQFFYKIRESYVGYAQKSLWIDVGAGDGGFLRSVHAKRKIGVETSQAGIEIMKSSGLKTMTDKQFLKTENLDATIISFWHMLEHVESPLDYLQAAQRNLDKSGKIIIGIPNFKSFEFSVFGKYWFHLVPQFHISHFSPKSIKKILNAADLKVERIDYWSIEHHLSGVLQSFINKSTHSDSILHKLIKRKQDLFALTMRQILSILFWCTLGLPIVIIFWIFGAIFQRSGTIVIVASKKRRSSR